MQVSTGKVTSVGGERKVKAEVVNRNQIACHVGHSKSHYVVVERNGVRTEPKLHIVHDSACYQCDTTEQTLSTGYTTTTTTKQITTEQITTERLTAGSTTTTTMAKQITTEQITSEQLTTRSTTTTTTKKQITTEQITTEQLTTGSTSTTTAPPRPPQGYCDNETLVSLITFMNIYFITELHYHATVSGC